MSEQKMPEALDAIRDLAVRLLNRKMPLEVSTGLRHIVKMARWKTALADPEDKIVYDEPHEHSDGLTYRILVFSENGKFPARWYHPSSHGFGAHFIDFGSQEEAIKAAINSIGTQK
jgi:hypothetical protein